MGNRVGGRPTRGADVVNPWHAVPRARGGPGEMDAEFASPDEGHAINMVYTSLCPRETLQEGKAWGPRTLSVDQ